MLGYKAKRNAQRESAYLFSACEVNLLHSVMKRLISRQKRDTSQVFPTADQCCCVVCRILRDMDSGEAQDEALLSTELCSGVLALVAVIEGITTLRLTCFEHGTVVEDVQTGTDEVSTARSTDQNTR